jgi:hypothetical protein
MRESFPKLHVRYICTKFMITRVFTELWPMILTGEIWWCDLWVDAGNRQSPVALENFHRQHPNFRGMGHLAKSMKNCLSVKREVCDAS